MSDSNHMAAFGEFGKWVPGFEFLKSLSQGGGSKAVPQMGALGHWVAPTVSVEELDKRIQELKTVLFWLEQNATALKATIQAMEVQKMTLATLQGMNVSMQDMAKAFSIPAPATSGMQAAAPAPDQAAKGFAGLEVPPMNPPVEPASRPRKKPQAKPAAAPAADAAAAPAGLVDPMQWWGALSQQFQTIADTALRDTKARTPEMPVGMKAATDLAEQASKTLAASAGQAGEAISQALKTTQAWTGAAKGAGKTSAKTRAKASPPSSSEVPVKSASATSSARQPASKRNTATARKSAPSSRRSR